jgi:hypothetical protein
MPGRASSQTNRFFPKAEISVGLPDVRFSGNTGLEQVSSGLPLLTKADIPVTVAGYRPFDASR